MLAYVIYLLKVSTVSVVSTYLVAKTMEAEKRYFACAVIVGFIMIAFVETGKWPETSKLLAEEAASRAAVKEQKKVTKEEESGNTVIHRPWLDNASTQTP